MMMFIVGAGSLLPNLEELPAVVHDEELAVERFGERRDGEARREAGRHLEYGLGARIDVEDPAGAEIAEDIAAYEPRPPRAAVDETPDDRGADVAAILGHRDLRGSRGSAAEPRIARALKAAPAEIFTDVHPVDFLDRRLSDVAHPQLPGATVEAEAKRVAKTQREDLRAGLCGRTAIGGV